MGDPVAELRAAVEDAAAALRDGAEGGASVPVLERPPKAEFGDFSTNAAMLLAPSLGEKPRGIADRLAAELEGRLEGQLEKVEVAGPGFLNLFLTDAWYRAGGGGAPRGRRRAGPPGGESGSWRGSTSSSSPPIRPAP